jgi:NAD(P)-dependent dehydrogenase (short-subunit alcohol dehydrogenase family)
VGPVPIASRAMYSLSGRVALVTGAQRGIGLETARALQKRGAQVVLADLDAAATERSAAELGGGAYGVGADVTDRARMDAVVAEVVERFGGLDVVVANAGIAPEAATARLMDDAMFERVLEVDLLGVWRTVRPALPQIVARQGHVVVVSSIYAFSNGMGNAPYAIAKAGVEQLGRLLRTELSIHGASATTAYFGFIDTAMVHESLDNNPNKDKLFDALPKPLHKRLPPSAAGEGIVRGIEKRAAQVILPKRWRALSMLRGLNPLFDAAALRRADVRELVRLLDA